MNDRILRSHVTQRLWSFLGPTSVSNFESHLTLALVD
jgi:hypothetical protein